MEFRRSLDEGTITRMTVTRARNAGRTDRSGLESALPVSDSFRVLQTSDPRQPRGQQNRMSYREFRDESGTEWEVWEVQPALVERRVVAQEVVGVDRRATSRRRAPVADDLR